MGYFFGSSEKEKKKKKKKKEKAEEVEEEPLLSKAPQGFLEDQAPISSCLLLSTQPPHPLHLESNYL